MTVCSARARSFAWLAILALLAVALAPTVSRVLASRLAPPQRAALCGSQGPGAAAAPAGDAGAVTVLAHLGSCAFCGPAFAGLAPLPEAWLWRGAPTSPEELQPSVAPRPPGGVAWASALPRAPPARG